MYPALDEELEDEQSLPLTGVNCAEIDEALRSLSQSEKQSTARTFDETRKLLKQVDSWRKSSLRRYVRRVLTVLSSQLQETVVNGHCDTESLKRTLQGFVEHGGIKVLVEVLGKCLKSECLLMWSAEDTFDTSEGCMRTFRVFEVLGSADGAEVWRQAPEEDQAAAIGIVVACMEAAQDGKFFDLRMQDAYNIVKCLQDLSCATMSTASVFVSCGGLSNLGALLSWPAEGMRHARWAASVVMSDAVTKALPLDTCNNWAVAPDSVQAISCMITALNLYNINGKDFLYESSVEGVLHVLKHLGQSPAYLGIISGVMEIFETGDVMFQKLRNNVRDTNVKNLATAVGHMCFPAGSEGCEPLGFRRRSLLRLLSKKSSVEEGPTYIPLPMC